MSQDSKDSRHEKRKAATIEEFVEWTKGYTFVQDGTPAAKKHAESITRVKDLVEFLSRPEINPEWPVVVRQGDDGVYWQTEGRPKPILYPNGSRDRWSTELIITPADVTSQNDVHNFALYGCVEGEKLSDKKMTEEQRRKAQTTHHVALLLN